MIPENADVIDHGLRRPSATAALRAGLGMQVAAPEKPGLLARFWSRRAPLPARREPCTIVGVLMLLDRSLALDGLVTGISTGSVLFRQASSFIFDRTGAEVSIRFGEHDRRGRIVSVTPEGYVVDLAEPLAEWQVSEMVQDYGQPLE